MWFRASTNFQFDPKISKKKFFATKIAFDYGWFHLILLDFIFHFIGDGSMNSRVGISSGLYLQRPEKIIFVNFFKGEVKFMVDVSFLATVPFVASPSINY